ncbi:hypothetical protein LCO01nite_13910 [Lapidilactobacillus concavus]|nr:hypothetical protein LCO01nite_13910 [Lapidilactobacillus concavus]
MENTVTALSDQPKPTMILKRKHLKFNRHQILPWVIPITLVLV